MRILGIDPGLEKTGWGVIETEGSALRFIAGGTVKSRPADPMSVRLKDLHDGLQHIMQTYQPQAVAVEEVFVNVNARTSLKLGQARGIAILVPALAGLPVAEYSPSEIKKAVVGKGSAEKGQVGYMVKVLLPRAELTSEDMADALAVAICHGHVLRSRIPSARKGIAS